MGLKGIGTLRQVALQGHLKSGIWHQAKITRWNQYAPNRNPDQIRRESLQCRGSNDGNSGSEQIRKPDLAVHLGTHAICDVIDNFSTILRGIDVNPEGTLSEGHFDDFHDGPGNIGDIGVGRRSCPKAFPDVLAEVSVRPPVLIILACLVRGHACVCAVICP